MNTFEGLITKIQGIVTNQSKLNILEAIKKLLELSFKTLNIDSYNGNFDIGLKNYFDLKDTQEDYNLLVRIESLLVIGAFCQINNNALYSLIELQNFKKRFLPGSKEYNEIDSLCYFWANEKKIMRLIKDSTETEHEKIIILQDLGLNFSESFLSQKLLDLLLIMNFIYSSMNLNK